MSVDLDQLKLDFDSDEACEGIDSYDIVDFDGVLALPELVEPPPFNRTIFDESSDEEDSVELVSIAFIVYFFLH